MKAQVKKSSAILKGNQHLKPLLVESAWAASHVKQCYLRRKYETLIGRRGKKRALLAVGHKILCAAYYILKNHESYKELGYDYLDQRRKKIRYKAIWINLKTSV